MEEGEGEVGHLCVSRGRTCSLWLIGGNKTKIVKCFYLPNAKVSL